MPELPDIVVYIDALGKRILGERLDRVRIASPFLLRTAAPPVVNAEGRTVNHLRRLGKRICIGLDNDIWLVLHLMIAGRLHWRKRDAKVSPPRGLAAFDFSNGTPLWTEAGSQKRASLHVVAGTANIAAQAGEFTLLRQKGNRGQGFQGTALLDEYFMNQATCPLAKVTLPLEDAPYVIDLCAKYGVTAATMFPDYYGAARGALDGLHRWQFDYAQSPK